MSGIRKYSLCCFSILMLYEGNRLFIIYDLNKKPIKQRNREAVMLPGSVV